MIYTYMYTYIIYVWYTYDVYMHAIAKVSDFSLGSFILIKIPWWEQGSLQCDRLIRSDKIVNIDLMAPPIHRTSVTSSHIHNFPCI